MIPSIGRTVAMALAAGLACTGLGVASANAVTADVDYAIDSPYASVDWSWAQYKSAFHNHTTKSDGGNTATEMLEQAYALGFNVYAMTDHNVLSGKSAFDNDGDTEDGFYLTTARKDAMAAGEGRDGKPGMIGTPWGDEQSVKDHLNTFWAPWNDTDTVAPEGGWTLESKMAFNDMLTGTPDPIMHINHPGRYYGGSNKATGEQAANDPAKIARYVGLFNQYPDSLVGMEIVNKVSDGDSYSDRIMWDNILQQTMPARNAYGFANDDAHSTGALGYAYNQLLMPELSEAAVYKTLKSGAWYSSALVAKRELGADFKGDRTKPAPVITNIAVDQKADSITIAAEGYNRIEWIADGKVIATGATLDLDDVSAEVDNYVRAQLIGDNGISFTNAFGVSMNVTSNNGRFLSDSEAAQAALASVGRTTADIKVVRDFGGKSKSFVVTITTADGEQVVRVDAETGEILA